MKMSELRKLVRQVITEAGGSVAVAGHTGRRGQDIDDYAAGPFKPDGNVTIPLRHQVDSSKEKRKQIPPQPELNWEDIDTKLEYDKVPDYAGSQFVNDTNDMKLIDIVMPYDKIENSDKSGFVNKSNDYKLYSEGTKTNKKVLLETSSTIGTSGGIDLIKKAQRHVNTTHNQERAAYGEMENSERQLQVANDVLDNLSSDENTPDQTITTTVTQTRYIPTQGTTNVYWDLINHPGVQLSVGHNISIPKPSLSNTANLTALRDVIKSDAEGREVAKVAGKTLTDFDLTYGTREQKSEPVYYGLDIEGSAVAFGGKVNGFIQQNLALGGSAFPAPNGQLLGKNPDYTKANQALRPTLGNDVELKSWRTWVKENNIDLLDKRWSTEAGRNILYTRWRTSLGGQNPPSISFTRTVAVEDTAYMYTSTNGNGGQIKGESYQTQKTVTNPAYTQWRKDLESAKDEVSQWQTKYDNDEREHAFKNTQFTAAENELTRIRDERKLSFRGMGKDSRSGAKAQIATGKGGKGRTLKGRRSKTAGGVRGGVPSLAALSGYKTAPKGKKGKKGKKKDEE